MTLAETNSIDITLQIRGKHAELLKLVRRFGSAKAAAEEIGVSQYMFRAWLNLKDYPKIDSSKSSLFKGEFREEFEKKMFDLTGKLLDELWPPSLRSNEFFGKTEEIEITRNFEFQNTVSNQSKITDLDAFEIVSRKEQEQKTQGDLEQVMRFLHEREQEIIRLHYGLPPYYSSCSYREIGKKFGVIGERVRQIELNALRKMKHRISLDPDTEETFRDFLGLSQTYPLDEDAPAKSDENIAYSPVLCEATTPETLKA